MFSRFCEKCRIRAYAERKPHSLIARLWRWHTTWCPGWKAYQRALAAKPVESPDKENHDHASCHP